MDGERFVELLSTLIELRCEVTLNEARGQQSSKYMYECIDEVKQELRDLVTQG
jgi:hypothetical protein